jgi:cytochrome c oxidase subunit 3
VGLFHELMKKPWETEGGPVVELHDAAKFHLPAATVGLRVFLAVVAVVFSLLIVVYADRMGYGDWRSLSDPWLLWLNTVVLVFASVTFEWARVSARRGQIDGVRVGLLTSGALTFIFLAGQIVVWRQLVASGYFAATNPAVAFFYLFTAVHGLHLVGGLVAWGRTTAKLWRGMGATEVRLSVELCAVYWHFLLFVWLVLFGLLLLT